MRLVGGQFSAPDTWPPKSSTEPLSRRGAASWVSCALVMANSPEDQRDRVFQQLMRWGFSMVVLALIITWILFVLPGW